MDAKKILQDYKENRISLAEAEKQLKLDYIQKIGNHTLFDSCRLNRKGVPEVVFGEGKTPSAISDILRQADCDLILVSRVSEEYFCEVKKNVSEVTYEKDAQVIVKGKYPNSVGSIGILAAGTSDVRTAEEARVMAASMGVASITAYDVGIAAFHRLLDPLVSMIDAGVDAIIVSAGMEGALASVVSSLSPVPVIGLPTAIGYGFGGSGETALRSMLQSCSPGMAVVNIGNGIGAGAFAAMISLRCRRADNGF